MDVSDILRLKKACSKQELFKECVYREYIESSYHQVVEHLFHDQSTTFIMLSRLISFQNKLERNREDFNSIYIHIGDICEVDFGDNYINESGFQHLAIILQIVNKKAFVVPLTSNSRANHQAIFNERRHLMYVGKVNGLNKESSLFLNDARYISVQRIISIKGNIDKESALFKRIKMKVVEMILK